MRHPQLAVPHGWETGNGTPGIPSLHPGLSPAPPADESLGEGSNTPVAGRTKISKTRNTFLAARRIKAQNKLSGQGGGGYF